MTPYKNTLDKLIRSAVDKIYELQQAKGSIKKKAIIEENYTFPYFSQLLYYALNPMLTYNISSKIVEGFKTSGVSADETWTDIFSLCEYLSGCKALTNETIYKVNAFLNQFDDRQRDLYIKLLSKTLKLGVTAATVNKVVPELIPVWEVQQAYPIDDYPIAEGKEFWVTQKLNGVRATYCRGRLYARSGVPFTGLEHIIDELQIADDDPYVFDGELTLKNKGSLSDNEAFRKATGIINSDGDKSEIQYTVFDVIPIEEFTGKSRTAYGDRRIFLDSVKATIFRNKESVNILPVLYHGFDQTMIPKILDQMVSEDKEGAMVNLDVPYKRTRHRGILKVKRFYTMDLPVIRCEEGSGRLTGMLGAVVVDYKGNEVSVGSGFTDEQRNDFWQRRDSLTGCLCEIKYKEISSNKDTGAESLQFPVFVSLREDKQEVSYG